MLCLEEMIKTQSPAFFQEQDFNNFSMVLPFKKGFNLVVNRLTVLYLNMLLYSAK